MKGGNEGPFIEPRGYFSQSEIIFRDIDPAPGKGQIKRDREIEKKPARVVPE
jgi:hypothetical protein